VTWLATLCVFGALSPFLVECGSDPLPSGGTIDLRAGTFDGVGIGDSPQDMRAEFGEPPPSDEQGVQPLGAGAFRGPTSFRHWPNPNPGRDFVPPPAYLYPHVSFLDDGNRRISVVMVVAPGAATLEGVAIGDPLETVRGVYPVRCGEEFGAGERPYPACVGELEAERWVWFGGDPIENITVGRFPMRRG
jgi:hypothetical protein